jgi:branched-subunit amino acid ABC-type transport system permease component
VQLFAMTFRSTGSASQCSASLAVSPWLLLDKTWLAMDPASVDDRQMAQVSASRRRSLSPWCSAWAPALAGIGGVIAAPIPSVVYPDPTRITTARWRWWW